MRRGGAALRVDRAIEGGVSNRDSVGGCGGHRRSRVHTHRRIAVPGRRGEAGAAAGVIHRETTGGLVEHRRFQHRGVARKTGARQLAAIVERFLPDAGDAAGDRHAGQLAATGERVTLDAGDAGGDEVGTGLAAGTLDERGLQFIKEHPVRTAVVRICRIYRDVRQPAATGERDNVERDPPDVGDAGGDRHARQPAVKVERSLPDAGDWQSSDGAGDAHHSANTGVCGDGDSTIRDGVGERKDLGNERPICS